MLNLILGATDFKIMSWNDSSFTEKCTERFALMLKKGDYLFDYFAA